MPNKAVLRPQLAASSNDPNEVLADPVHECVALEVGPRVPNHHTTLRCRTPSTLMGAINAGVKVAIICWCRDPTATAPFLRNQIGQVLPEPSKTKRVALDNQLNAELAGSFR